MNRRPERLGDLLPGVLADLVATHTTVNGEPPMTTTAPKPPTHTGGSWEVDRFVRLLAEDMYRKGLLTDLSEKTVARLTVATAKAFGFSDLGELKVMVELIKAEQARGAGAA